MTGSVKGGSPMACVGALLAALAVAACSSKPFETATNFDRTFLNAAQTWDLDKSGSVTCAEWQQYVGQGFREADANRDGALDATEFASMARSDRLFDVADLAYYDANGDKRVTVDEMTGKQNLAFKLLDKNGDCAIDRTESVQIYGSDKPKPKEKEMDQTIPGSRR